MPESEPQHPKNPDYRQGIYHSRMFSKPGSNEAGIHSIILDNRSERDNVYTSRVISGCKGKATKILSDEQWAWLEKELERESEIKIIGNGIQVLDMELCWSYVNNHL